MPSSMGTRSAASLAPARQPQGLDGGDVVGEALPGEGGVVEVLVPAIPSPRS